MKEIIYIQAGNISNHIGTHFWNTQESYFTYNDDSEPLVNHDISFREGLSLQNEPTFCPRVLMFDHRSNFGPLSKYNELYADTSDADQPLSKGLWSGPVAEHRQEIITKSEYLQRLEEREDVVDDDDSIKIKPSEIRYWSDYNRVYYIPRSIQQIPDLPDWQASKGNWNYGRSVFKRFDLDNSLNEDSLRRLLEESNNCQGFQMLFDNSPFGGFTAALLETIRDEFPKIPVLTFPLLSGVDPTKIDVEDVAMRKLALQDAACMCALDELATQSVPIKSPATWRLGKWSDHLIFDKSKAYQTSAILSAHIESTTLPLRLKGGQKDLSDICSQLNWAQNTRFSHLSGVLPFVGDDDLSDGIYDFSAVVEPSAKTKKRVGQCLVQRNVLRGFSIDQARSTEAFFASSTALEDPYLSSIHAPAYPLPTSFPDIFRQSFTHPSTATARKHTHSPGGRSTSLLSSLYTTFATAGALQGYAALTRACVVRRYSGADAAGLEADEVRETVEKLSAMAEAYAGDDGEGEEEDVTNEVGEDEDIE